MFNISNKLLLVVLSLVVSLFPISGFSIANAKSFNESEVKVAYIYKIAKYVEWPAEANLSTDSLHICLLGKSRYMQPFDLLEGKQVGKRSIRITKLFDDYANAMVKDPCHMVYVAMDHKVFWSEWKDSDALSHALVISFDLSLRGEGGIILFDTKDQHVKFFIDISEARKRGFNFRAQLLEVAEIIK